MTPRSRPPTRRGLARPDTNERQPPTATVPSTPHQPPPRPGLNAAGVDTDQTGEQVLLTAEQAATLLQVRPSWLRRKAAARAVPCRYLGKHLRFSRADIHAIADASARPPRQSRRTPNAD
jgi:hypothetical protein